MYILLEHAGTKEHTKSAEYLSDLIENEFGATVDQVVSDEHANFCVYNEDLEKLGEFENTNDNDDYVLALLADYYD